MKVGTAGTLTQPFLSRGGDKIHRKSGALSITVRWAFVPLGQPISKQAAFAACFFLVLAFKYRFWANRALTGC